MTERNQEKVKDRDLGAEFLDAYSHLESLVSERFDLDGSTSAIGYLMRECKEFSSLRDELDYCREVRNLLVHKPKVEGDWAVEPSENMVKLLRRVADRFENPPRARTFMVPVEKVLCKTMQDKVLPTLQEMRNYVYTHIPLLEGGKVVGAFSEGTLLTALADKGRMDLDESTCFQDLAGLLPLDKHEADTFRFVSLNERVSTIAQMFQKSLDKGERLGMVFVTQSGKATEKLLGIITAWDLAAYKDIEGF